MRLTLNQVLKCQVKFSELVKNQEDLLMAAGPNVLKLM